MSKNKEITLQHYKIINNSKVGDEDIGSSIKKRLTNKVTFSERLRTPNEESDEREGCSKYKVIEDNELFMLFAMLAKGSTNNIDKSLLDKKQVEFDDLRSTEQQTESMRDFTYFYVYHNDVILLSKRTIPVICIDLYIKWLLNSSDYFLEEQTQKAVADINGTTMVVAPTKKITIKTPSDNTAKDTINIQESALSRVLEVAGISQLKKEQILHQRQLRVKLVIEASSGYELNEVFSGTIVRLLKDNVRVETKEGVFTASNWKQKKKTTVQVSSTGKIDELDLEVKMQEYLKEVLRQ